MAGDVAGGPHPGIGRLEIVTDLDRASLGELDARLVESEPGGVGPAAGGHQDPINPKLLLLAAYLEGHDPTCALPANPDHLYPGQHAGSVLLQHFSQSLGGLRLFEGSNSGRHLQEGDLGPQPHEELPHLQANGVGADHSERLGHLPELKRGGAGKEPRFL